jgi:hypothetical protein
MCTQCLSLSGTHSREHDRIYLVITGIERYLRSYQMPVSCPMSRLSQFQMTSVVTSLLPFAMDCSLYLGEGISVGSTHNDLGRSLDSIRL